MLLSELMLMFLHLVAYMVKIGESPKKCHTFLLIKHMLNMSQAVKGLM